MDYFPFVEQLRKYQQFVLEIQKVVEFEVLGRLLVNIIP